LPFAALLGSHHTRHVSRIRVNKLVYNKTNIKISFTGKIPISKKIQAGVSLSQPPCTAAKQIISNTCVLLALDILTGIQIDMYRIWHNVYYLRKQQLGPASI
jgi:hypothetical protein